MPNNNSNRHCHFIHIKKLGKCFVKPEDYDSIVWDLDGTLYSIPALKLKIIKSLYKFSVLKNVLNFFRTESIIQKERQKHLFGLQEYKHEFYAMQSFINSYLDQALVKPEALQLALEARNHNLNQLVVSEYPIGNKLELLGINEHFHGAYSCCEDMGCWKPAEKTARFVLSKLGNPKRVLVIGDRDDTDGKLAENINELLNKE
ncbi:MAG: hypothetical protein CME64_11655 [Halobacteriovoraceae bacterium]|nr:hypothetical protein [Halobacteriovoraceae bacterium]|tara:strand:+ start:82410 stop:83018 length:609 start_codon:yes stop_codon:yes gene_type:complete